MIPGYGDNEFQQMLAPICVSVTRGSPSKLTVSAARPWETRVNHAIKRFQDPVCFVSFVSFPCLQTTCLSLIFLNPWHLKHNCAQTLHPFLTKMTFACHENCQGRVYKETLHAKQEFLMFKRESGLSYSTSGLQLGNPISTDCYVLPFRSMKDS